MRTPTPRVQDEISVEVGWVTDELTRLTSEDLVLREYRPGKRVLEFDPLTEELLCSCSKNHIRSRSKSSKTEQTVS